MPENWSMFWRSSGPDGQGRRRIPAHRSPSSSRLAPGAAFEGGTALRIADRDDGPGRDGTPSDTEWARCPAGQTGLRDSEASCDAVAGPLAQARVQPQAGCDPGLKRPGFRRDSDVPAFRGVGLLDSRRLVG